jgi:hypothetical protein
MQNSSDGELAELFVPSAQISVDKQQFASLLRPSCFVKSAGAWELKSSSVRAARSRPAQSG